MATGVSIVPETAPVRYSLDTRLSRFAIKVSAGGPLAKLGHNPTILITDFTGEIEYYAERFENSRLSIQIQPSALTVADDLNDKDRAEIRATMLSDVLEEPQFPLISFDSTEIAAERVLDGLFRLTVTGTLALHGVQRRLTFPSQVAFVGDTLRASGDFPVLQSNYGIKLFSFAAGALRVKDDVKCTFDLVARKVAS
jgi:polyisoprenoid-binding protein YceI